MSIALGAGFRPPLLRYIYIYISYIYNYIYIYYNILKYCYIMLNQYIILSLWCPPRLTCLTHVIFYFFCHMCSCFWVSEQTVWPLDLWYSRLWVCLGDRCSWSFLKGSMQEPRRRILLVSNIFLCSIIYGMSTFPLTNSYFSRWSKPPTRLTLPSGKLT